MLCLVQKSVLQIRTISDILMVGFINFFAPVFMLKKRTSLPHRHLKELLPSFLKEVETRYEEKPDRVLKGWAEVADPKWRSMTEACSFEKGIIVVKVGNAALLSLLIRQKGAGLLKKLQEKFPENSIKKINFRIG